MGVHILFVDSDSDDDNVDPTRISLPRALTLTSPAAQLVGSSLMRPRRGPELSLHGTFMADQLAYLSIMPDLLALGAGDDLSHWFGGISNARMLSLVLANDLVRSTLLGIMQIDAAGRHLGEFAHQTYRLVDASPLVSISLEDTDIIILESSLPRTHAHCVCPGCAAVTSADTDSSSDASSDTSLSTAPSMPGLI